MAFLPLGPAVGGIIRGCIAATTETVIRYKKYVIRKATFNTTSPWTGAAVPNSKNPFSYTKPLTVRFFYSGQTRYTSVRQVVALCNGRWYTKDLCVVATTPAWENDRVET
jgi:hypothetical protein